MEQGESRERTRQNVEATCLAAGLTEIHEGTPTYIL